MRRDRLKTVAMTDCARHRFDIMLLVLLLALAGVVFAGLALGSSSIGASDVVAYAMGNASDMAVNVLANVQRAACPRGRACRCCACRGGCAYPSNVE